MLTTIEKIIHLKKVPLFENLTGELLVALSNISYEKEFKKNDIIFKQDIASYELYVIVSGKVEVFRENNAEKHTVHTFFSTEYFCEMALLEDMPRSLSAIAIEDTLCLVIPKEPFLDLMNEEPSIAIEIIKLLGKRLREVNLRLK